MDFQVLTNSTTEMVSFAFTGRAIGMLIGSLMLGVMYDRFNKWLIFTVALFYVSLTVLLIAWAKTIIYLGVLFFAAGLGIAVQDGCEYNK